MTAGLLQSAVKQVMNSTAYCSCQFRRHMGMHTVAECRALQNSAANATFWIVHGDYCLKICHLGPVYCLDTELSSNPLKR
jgi:hypothetical protein